MKYMTPESYARSQFASLEENLALDDEWEANGVVYRERFATFADSLPRRFREFIDTWCLHDAELRSFEIDTATHSVPPVATMNLRLRDKRITLFYDLLEIPERRPVEIGLTPEQSQAVWTTPDMTDWLYDEVDVLGDVKRPSGFVHEILLSTGETIRIVFFAFDWHVHQIGAALPADATSR